VLYYLSGLTCTDENVIQKSGVQRACAQHGIAFVAPDTSPRGLNVEGEAESWDFGVRRYSLCRWCVGGCLLVCCCA
jgi:S-formylglutathione hydrolase